MNNKLLVEEKQSEIGNFMVGRLLPFRKKRQVGPFTFIDHMGPAQIGPQEFLDVDQHPHIGLSTLTYLFVGQIHHRDSMGSDQVIHPGDVGFMTSGNGVTHTERTPQAMRDGNVHNLHGYQIWVALPKAQEDIKPTFQYFTADQIPHWEDNGLNFKLAAGKAFGKEAPLQGYSPLFMVDIYAEKANTLSLKNQLAGEVAFVIVKGSVLIGDECVKAGQMLISKTDDACSITFEKETQVLLFGGDPLQDEHFLNWNFVSHSKEKLKKAVEDWKNKKFPKVPHDETYIPYPTLKK